MKKNLLLSLLIVFSVNVFAQSSNKTLAFDKTTETLLWVCSVFMKSQIDAEKKKKLKMKNDFREKIQNM